MSRPKLVRDRCTECDGYGVIEYTPMAGEAHGFTGTCRSCGGSGLRSDQERRR